MKGKIYSWNEQKGFAFIEVENSKRRVFAHISNFAQNNPKPKVGEMVVFDLFSDEKGRFSAKNVRYINRQQNQNPHKNTANKQASKQASKQSLPEKPNKNKPYLKNGH